MMRRLLLGILGAFLLFPTAALAQPDDDALTIGDVDVSAHPAVSMVVTVPGSVAGGGLDSSAFSITENGESRPVAATSIASDDLNVVLLLDASGSMWGEPAAAMREAALGFVEAMPRGVQTAVVSFATEAVVLTEFTTDEERLGDAVAELTVGGETALYDGLAAAAALFEGTEGRRVVVLLSDGGDTVSRGTLEEAMAAVVDHDAGFYAIELQSPENDREALTRLTEATGGSLVAVTDPAALAGIFGEVAGQLTNRYRLSYESVAFGDAAVTVSVDIEGRSTMASRSIVLPDAPPPPPVERPEPTVAVAAEPPPMLRRGYTTPIGFLETTPGLVIGLAALFLATAGVVLVAGMGRRDTPTVLARQTAEAETARKAEATRYGAAPASTETTGLLSNLAERATNMAERSLQRDAEAGGAVTELLERSGVWLRPGELIVLTVCLAVGGAALGMVLLGPWAAGGLAVLGPVLVRWRLTSKATKRQAAFAEQLPDVLHLMSGGLRAGFGLMQTIDNVATEMPAPAGEEFQRVKVEAHLGRDTDHALRAMARRVGSEDFEWVVQAMEINREVGGDLGEILDSVGSTIRDRARIRRRIKSLSAEGRVSGLVLALLPVVLAVILSVVNPSYIGELTSSSSGRIAMGVGLGVMTLGAVWMRAIVKPKF